MTEEMMQAMAFEVAKIAVTNNSKNQNGMPYSAENLATMMHDEYLKALSALKTRQEQWTQNFENAAKVTALANQIPKL